jgi:DNA-binding IclR family transcriptional regulator
MVEQNMMINPMSPQRAAVLEVLHQAGRPLRLFEIADRTRMKPTNVAALLYAMKEDGQADYTGPRSMRCWTATTEYPRRSA